MKPFVNKSLFVVSLLLVGSLFFSSCHKDKNDPTPSHIPLIASVLRYDNLGNKMSPVSFEYDNQGRVIKKDDGRGNYLTMEYSDSSIIVTNISLIKSLFEGTYIYKLNSKGLCTLISREDSFFVETFEYDSNGYIKSFIYKADTGLDTYTYTVSEGNYVTTIFEYNSETTNSAILKEFGSFNNSFLPIKMEKRFAPENRLKSAAYIDIRKTDSQFYTDKINTIGAENTGEIYLGKQNKNPIKKVTLSSSNQGNFVETKTINYTYEYDNKGRITKQTSSEGEYTIFTYLN